jgi:hypothetical protein
MANNFWALNDGEQVYFGMQLKSFRGAGYSEADAQQMAWDMAVGFKWPILSIQPAQSGFNGGGPVPNQNTDTTIRGVFGGSP